MKLRSLLVLFAASILPLAAVQAPQPSSPQTAPFKTKNKKKDKVAPATPAPSAAPATAKAPARQSASAAVASGFVGNKDSKIVHRADCKLGAKISAAHRVTFASAAEAQAAGYKACKVCKPF